jgi:hypothetical protein
MTSSAISRSSWSAKLPESASKLVMPVRFRSPAPKRRPGQPLVGENVDESAARAQFVGDHVPVATDRGMDAAADVDQRLWIRSNHCDGRDFLVGSCHSFLGRMASHCPHSGRDYCVSRDEIIEMSAESELWVSGFLAGASPPPPPTNDGPEANRMTAAWEQASRAFRCEGRWPDDVAHGCYHWFEDPAGEA